MTSGESHHSVCSGEADSEDLHHPTDPEELCSSTDSGEMNHSMDSGEEVISPELDLTKRANKIKPGRQMRKMRT